MQGYKRNDVITGAHSLELLFCSVPTDTRVVSFPSWLPLWISLKRSWTNKARLNGSWKPKTMGLSHLRKEKDHHSSYVTKLQQRVLPAMNNTG